MLFVFACRCPLKLQIFCQLYQLTMRYYLLRMAAFAWIITLFDHIFPGSCKFLTVFWLDIRGTWT